MLAWKSNGNAYMTMLKEKGAGLTTDRKLDEFDWKLAMPIGRSAVENTKLGDLKSNIQAAVAELTFEAAGDKVALQLNKTQLQGLYEEIEKMQIKIDELTK